MSHDKEITSERHPFRDPYGTIYSDRERNPSSVRDLPSSEIYLLESSYTNPIRLSLSTLIVFLLWIRESNPISSVLENRVWSRRKEERGTWRRVREKRWVRRFVLLSPTDFTISYGTNVEKNVSTFDILRIESQNHSLGPKSPRRCRSVVLTLLWWSSERRRQTKLHFPLLLRK